MSWDSNYDQQISAIQKKHKSKPSLAQLEKEAKQKNEADRLKAKQTPAAKRLATMARNKKARKEQRVSSSQLSPHARAR